MCTRARLVQAGRASDWLGMPMPNAPVPPANVSLTAGQPAYLEVTVDPAAHGDAGLGRIRRGVVLETAGGEIIRFELVAEVVR